MLHDNVLQTLIVQLDLNRNGDSEREMPPGTVFDLRLYPTKQRAINDGQIIIVRADDANADPAEIADMARSSESARMLVPLIVREQVIGLLQIEMLSKFRALTHREVRMAQALGAQAASSIENARLSTETAAQVEHSLVMNELSRAVSSTMDISDMLRIVRDQVPPMLDADTLYVALYNEDTEDIVFPMAVTEGRDIFIPPRVLGRDEVSFIIRNRRPLSLGGDNPSADQVRSNLRIENGEGDALRYLGVPLIAGDQTVGVLAIRDSRVSRPFGLNDQRILSTIGTQLSAAIQNAHLFERVRTFADELNLRVEERTKELQSERDRLDALFRITVELGSTLDMDRLLRGALENVARVIGADDGVVLLVNPLTDRLYTRATLTPADGEPPTIIELDGEHPFHPAEMLGNWLMLQTMDRAYVADDLVMQGYWDISAPGADAYRSALAVMLETQEDAQGAMIFLGRDSGQFTEDQLKLVQTAALQVSTAINNAELYSLIRDQAERMGTLLRVEQEEAGKNSAILEGIADGVMLVDASEVIVLFNNAAERILDLPRDYALGQQLSRLSAVSPDAEQWIGALRGWIARQGQGDGASIEDRSLVIDRLDVGQRIVSIRASAVYIGSELLGTVAVLRDVTKEVEVDRMKSEFIANVTHELRTPLTSIVGYIDLMMMGGAGSLGEQPMRFLTTIKTNADRLRNLVEDLLSISELDSGRGKLNLEAVDLADTIMTVARSVDETFAARGKTMRLVTEIAPDIGTIQADKVKFGQIIANILENAYHYTYADGTVTVRAARERDGAHVLISIADTGIGIPEAFRERIWNRFERYEEHALVMDVAGTGLGLPIVKTLVELHNGRVWFETEVNRGTTFYIRLPVEPGQTRVSDPLARLAAPALPESDAAPTNGHAEDIEQTQPLEEG
jgi:signal transduction histidine kinase/putative methionine-R-sulfoxide reductase with GAF domain